MFRAQQHVFILDNMFLAFIFCLFILPSLFLGYIILKWSVLFNSLAYLN